MNQRNPFTTHPQIRARRERALERLQRGIKSNGKPYREDTREQGIQALQRKLASGKQGSAR